MARQTVDSPRLNMATVTTYFSVRALERAAGIPRDVVLRQLANQIITPDALLNRGGRIVPLFTEAAVAVIRSNQQPVSSIPKLS